MNCCGYETSQMSDFLISNDRYEISEFIYSTIFHVFTSFSRMWPTIKSNEHTVSHILPPPLPLMLLLLVFCHHYLEFLLFLILASSHNLVYFICRG